MAAGAKFFRGVLLRGMDEQRLILVVEDDEATQGFLVENLVADGFRAVGASSAGEGLRAIEVRRPSLVLLDLALEGGNGLDLLDRVHRANRTDGRGGPDPELRPRRRRPRVQADVLIARRCRAPSATTSPIDSGGSVCRPGEPRARDSQRRLLTRERRRLLRAGLGSRASSEVKADPREEAEIGQGGQGGQPYADP
jgi:CheY-like chemotaxis protein